MSNGNPIPANLGAGEFYGQVPEKRAIGSSILCEVVHARAFDVPEHSHELAYFTLVLGGAYTERFGRDVRDHDPMSVLWHRAGISHKDRVGECGARCFTVEIKPQAVENLAQYSAVPIDFSETGTPLVWLAARLFREFKRWGLGSDLIAEGLTLEMLGQAARRGIVVDKRPPDWLRRVVERIRAEFTSSHSTSRLAQEAGIHPVHLATVFRKFHGRTIGEYTQQLRVSHASQLMVANRRLELAEIAHASGFSDQSHFNRLFKRHTGMTPTEFRRSLA